MTNDEYFQKINKKNKTSAVLFLVGAFAVFLAAALVILIFIIFFGALQAVFSGVLGSRAAGDSWSALSEMARTFWVFVLFAAAAIVPQVVAGVAMLKKTSWARTAGIVAFFVTLLTFTPFALLLIYPFAFLLGNDGKYLYQSSIKK